MIKTTNILVVTAFMMMSLAVHGESVVMPPSSGLKQAPPLAQNNRRPGAINEWYACIDKNIKKTDNGTAAPTSAKKKELTSHCSAEQTKLKQTLPADAYNKFMGHTDRYISQAAAKRANAKPINSPAQ